MSEDFDRIKAEYAMAEKAEKAAQLVRLTAGNALAAALAEKAGVHIGTIIQREPRRGQEPRRYRVTGFHLCWNNSFEPIAVRIKNDGTDGERETRIWQTYTVVRGETE